MNENNILKKIEEYKVFDVKLIANNTKLLITEGCDYFFDIELNKQEVLNLAKAFKHIANNMNTNRKEIDNE